MFRGRQERLFFGPDGLVNRNRLSGPGFASLKTDQRRKRFTFIRCRTIDQAQEIGLTYVCGATGHGSEHFALLLADELTHFFQGSQLLVGILGMEFGYHLQQVDILRQPGANSAIFRAQSIGANHFRRGL